MSLPLPMIACLPMYDWPEIHAHTGRYWQVLRQVLLEYGFGEGLPETLTHHDDPHAMWLDSGLVLGQTCGLPYVSELRGKVTLLGAPTYAIGCDPGQYCSVIIARSRSGDIDPFATPGLRFAYNDACSQSGLAAWLAGVRETGGSLPRNIVPVHTGSHRASIQAVAEDRADLAAIDAVTFELARRHEPAAKRVTVLARTPETPGLPYIASALLAERKEDMCCAIEDAIGELDDETSEALLIECFRRYDEADYDGIAANWQAVQAAGLDRVFAG